MRYGVIGNRAVTKWVGIVRFVYHNAVVLAVGNYDTVADLDGSLYIFIGLKGSLIERNRAAAVRVYACSHRAFAKGVGKGGETIA